MLDQTRTSRSIDPLNSDSSVSPLVLAEYSERAGSNNKNQQTSTDGPMDSEKKKADHL